MRNWSEAEEGYCSGSDDLDMVDRVCKHLKIDYKVTEFQKVILGAFHSSPTIYALNVNQFEH